MKKPRHTILLIVDLLLFAGGYLLLTDPWSTTWKDFEAILPSDVEEVTNIQVINGYDTLEFVRSDTLWSMEGEELNSEAVDNLLYATERLRVTGIVPVDELWAMGTMTEFVFSGKRKVRGHFILGKRDNGYLIFEPGAETGFGVELAGFEDLPLQKVFSDTRDHYRKHLLVGLLPSEIRSVRVYPHEGTPFEARQDSLYNVMVTDLSTMGDVTDSVKERKIRLLFSYFNAIRYDVVVTAAEIEPGIVDQAPYAVVHVSGLDGRYRKLEVYQWIKPGAEKSDLFEALVVFNDTPLYRSVNYYYLDLLMRGLESYF
jgi:hypothetical protein